MKTSRRFSKLAVEHRQLWVEHHRRRPTEIRGPHGELLWALIHRSVQPVLPTPVASHRVTPELAWRVAAERIAVLVTLRGKVAAALRPLTARSECEELEPEELLRCADPGFCGSRNAMLEAIVNGERSRVLFQLHDLLLAQLRPVPPPAPAARVTVPAPLKPRQDEQPRNPSIEVIEDHPDEELEPNSIPLRSSTPLTPEQTQRVEQHTDLVRRLARLLSRRIGPSIGLSRGELESAGNEALVWAARRYDPSRPASFGTYAHYRVYGAMMDAIRQEWRISGYYEHPLVHLAAALTPSPEQALIAADERSRVRTLIDQLKERERALVDAVYGQDRTLTELAKATGVHASTICRRHAKILERLGKRLRAQEWSIVPLNS
jgi:RNA polymerase sigma factor for flagellar operon FliA